MRVVVVLKTTVGALWSVPHMTELRSRGHEVIAVLPPGPGRLRDELAGAGIAVLDSAFDFRFGHPIRTAIGLRRLRRQLRDLHADVFFAHLYASVLALRLATAGLGVPRVHMVAGPLYLEAPVLRQVERVLSRMDARIIAGSEASARLYRRVGDPSRIDTIPYGVDTARFLPPDTATRAAARIDLGIPADHFVPAMVAYVYAPKDLVHRGRGVKGHDVLLQAWRTFHRNHPDSTLLIAGSGFDAAGEAYREQLLRAHRVGDADSGVRWVAHLEDVRPAYAAADLSVSPSLSDNHGAAVEAGALGVPSIVSDAGGLPETVDERSGWVVPAGNVAALADALERAYAEHRAGRLTERGRNARELMVARFDWSRAASDVADVLERVAGRTASVFTDARFDLDSDGNWASQDGLTGPSHWQSLRESFGTVHVVARAAPVDHPVESQPVPGITLAPLPYYLGLRGALVQAPRLAAAVWRRTAIGLPLIQQPGLVGTVAALSCRVRRKPYAVVMIGDPDEVLRVGTLGERVRRVHRAATAATRYAVRHAVGVRYVTRAALQEKYPPNIDASVTGISNVRLVPGDFVTVPHEQPARGLRLTAIGSQEQRYKGHDVLLDALALLREQRDEVTLTLVGDGRYRPDLEAQAIRLGIENAVTFTGWISDRADIHRILDESDVFVMPSLTEGMPRALIEAMARGLPAVASKVGGIVELLPPEVLVSPGDPVALARAIRDLADDRDRYTAAAADNLATAQQYDRASLHARETAWLLSVIELATEPR